jgi:hypothetical protein
VEDSAINAVSPQNWNIGSGERQLEYFGQAEFSRAEIARNYSIVPSAPLLISAPPLTRYPAKCSAPDRGEGVECRQRSAVLPLLHRSAGLPPTLHFHRSGWLRHEAIVTAAMQH